MQKTTQQTRFPFETNFALDLISLTSKLQLYFPLGRIMLDYRHGLARNQVSSFHPAYQIARDNCPGKGDIEFDFWGARRTWYYDTFNNLDGSQIEFQVQACVEESFGDCPLPFLGVNKVSDSSPLLPNNHFYSNISPTTRKQAIEEGRKQLMDMIRNMPESSYELSLKDIVDKQHVELAKEKAVSEDKNILFDTESQKMKQKKKRKKAKACQISRTGSMDADNFLLKMFFSTSLSFKKKSTADNRSKVSPNPSCEVSKRPVDKKWWIKRILLGRNHKNRQDGSDNGIHSDNSSTSRHASKSSLPGCWLFFLSNKSKAKKQGASSEWE
ncbi:hypothetical protein DITRI_Ditri18aG0039400 [Diplodiscus trichospermus]